MAVPQYGLIGCKLPCRRITNRESAQRMRRKRQEDFQSVCDRLSMIQAENARLKQVCILTCMCLSIVTRPAGKPGMAFHPFSDPDMRI